ncbi:hypothetical protein HYV11_02095 [Candidatus Dependentiae bacterium]|nr:hypothetical protein [Candidatus Dependentiae bacterium]
MNLYTKIQKNISNYYRMLLQQNSSKYVKETVLATVIILGATVGYFGHSYYVKKREERAFGALVEVVEFFEKAQMEAMQSEKKDTEQQHDVNAWQDTLAFIDALYEQNSNSYLAPYFMIFKAQVALQQGVPVDEVRTIFEKALLKMPKKSALYDLFNFKRVMMSFDSANEGTRNDALSELIVIAKDEKGYCFEEANYILGLYYLYQDDIDQARNAWKSILKETDSKILIPSSWVKLAQEKLETISLD